MKSINQWKDNTFSYNFGNPLKTSEEKKATHNFVWRQGAGRGKGNDSDSDAEENDDHDNDIEKTKEKQLPKPSKTNQK